MNFPAFCYVCKYCKRAFREASLLLTHKQQHHREELLKDKKLRKSINSLVCDNGKKQDLTELTETPKNDLTTKGPWVDPIVKGQDLPPALDREESFVDVVECSFSSASTIVSSDSSSRDTSVTEERVDDFVETPVSVNQIDHSKEFQLSQSIQTRASTSAILGPLKSLASGAITPVIKPGVSGSSGQKRKFTCIHCFKKFATKWNCKVHMATHTGKMPLKCQFCPQIFYKLVEKVAHELTHRETMKQVNSMNPRVEVTKLNVHNLPKLSTADQPKLKGSETPKQNGNETPKQNGNETPKQNGNETPKQKEPETSKPKETEAPKLIETEALKLKQTEAPKLKGTETLKLKGTEALKLRETEVPKLKETETLKLKEIETLKLKATEAPKLKETETSKLKETEAPKLIETETPKLKENETPKLKETETPKQNGNKAPTLKETETPKQNGNKAPTLKETETLKQNGNEAPALKETVISALQKIGSLETGSPASKPEEPKSVIIIPPKPQEALKPTTELVTAGPTLEKQIKKAIIKPNKDRPAATKPKKRRKVRFASMSFKCKQCSRSYSSKSALRAHAKRVHYLSQPSLECNYCSKIFFTAQERMAHEKLHVKHNCPCCKQRFATSGNLMAHIKSVHPLAAEISNGSTPASCSTLLEGSQRQSADQSKPQINSGLAQECSDSPKGVWEFGCDTDIGKRNDKRKEVPRGFQCSFCNKSFRLKLTLKVHERIHTGVRPYKCPECPQAFTQSHVLTEHYRTHTGEKPHSCSFCGKKFSHKSSYNVHVKAHQKNVHGKISGKFDDVNVQNHAEDSVRKFKSLELAEGITQTLSSGLLVYICDMCKLTFDYRVDANGHSMVHA